MQVHGKAVSVPGRALAGIISSLKGSMEPDSFELLQLYHQMVVNYLRATSSASKSAPEVETMQQQLADKLESVKALAGIKQSF